MSLDPVICGENSTLTISLRKPSERGASTEVPARHRPRHRLGLEIERRIMPSNGWDPHGLVVKTAQVKGKFVIINK